MPHYEIIGILLSFSALVTYINERYIKLPTTIALMSASLLSSLLLLGFDYLSNNHLEQIIRPLLFEIDFKHFLLNGVLNLLLFAGGININLNHLYQSRYEITLLALVSTLLSTVLIAVVVYYLAPLCSIQIPWLYCFLLGAIISPTDPIAVLALFKQLRVPTKLEMMVSGESLFNDGVAIVIFALLSFMLKEATEPSATQVLYLFMKLGVGGLLYGILLGVFGYFLIATINDPKIEILITLAMATGGYYLANHIGVSGPLAMVSAGIFIGNHGRYFAMSKQTWKMLDVFWELIDEILNAVLFFLIGAELLLIPFYHTAVSFALILLPIFILIRAITVYIPLKGLGWHYPKYFRRIIIWGGLRGGLAVALALSLPSGELRDLILIITYVKVMFSVLIQGTSIKYLVNKI